MAKPTDDELLTRIEAQARLIEAQGRQIEALASAARPRRTRRSARLALSAVALATMLLVPAGAFALHSFTDVPDSNTFHTNIGRVKGAGITAGCTPTKYCPDANVTRGQMAAFLARTGGRSATDGVGRISGPVLSTSSEAPTVLATVSIKAGDVTGGYATIQLTGSFTAYTTSATGLPSYAATWIREVGTTTVLSSYGMAQIDAIAGGSFGIDTAGIVGAVVVPTGVSKSYELVANRVYGSGGLSGFATLSAVYIPFSGDGSNVVPAAAPAPAPVPGPLLGPVAP